MVRIAVIIAVHNRWNLTEDLLNKLQSLPSVDLCVHIVDDGSTDDTQLELAKRTEVISQRAHGNLFWAKSMKLAQDSVTDPIDYFLWLNNDVNLAPNFLSTIQKSISANPETILVGQTSDIINGQITYGGLRRIGRHPHRLQKICATESYVPVDTFCGNFVLIPSFINAQLGGIDGSYEHGFADYDYGYRASKMGFPIKAIPGFIGTCPLNLDVLQSLSSFKAVKTIFSSKYLPFRSQIRFCKRHGGPEWLAYVISPYLRKLLGYRKYKSNQIDSSF